MHRLLSGVLQRGSNAKRFFSTSNKLNTKVALIGAGGGIGSPLSLLLKHSPYIQNLCLYDVKDITGMAEDLSHIDTSSKVLAFTGEEGLKACLDGAEMVVITAGVPRKPGMDRSDLFNVNAKLIMDITHQIVQSTFNPLICIGTNPVNSLVPIAAKVLEKNGVFDSRKLFGITTLDVVRANTFFAKLGGLNPADVNVPVVGGHSGTSIVPLFSIATPKCPDPSAFNNLVDKVRGAGTDVVMAKKGQGSATHAMAYATFRFLTSLLQARFGKEDIVECCYTYTNYHDDVDFFTDPVKLYEEGYYSVMDYTNVSEEEKGMILSAKDVLKREIKLGYDFVEKNYVAPTKVRNIIYGPGSTEPFADNLTVPDYDDTSKYDRQDYTIPKSKLGSDVPHPEVKHKEYDIDKEK